MGRAVCIFDSFSMIKQPCLALSLFCKEAVAVEERAGWIFDQTETLTDNDDAKCITLNEQVTPSEISLALYAIDFAVPASIDSGQPVGIDG
jgi:hypothetical protein